VIDSASTAIKNTPLIIPYLCLVNGMVLRKTEIKTNDTSFFFKRTKKKHYLAYFGDMRDLDI
jgi:hypothetical protein